jgi:hypothetical protein
MKKQPPALAFPDWPHLREVFEALRRGRHLSARDGDLFQALKQHTDAFEKLFDQLGFRLEHHPRDFFYFRNQADLTDLSSRMAVFLFILIEWLADRGDPVEETLLTRIFAIDELPHLQSERYCAYMKEAGVLSTDDLVKIIQTLERFGFARRREGHSFSFETPVYRFLDLCIELAAEATDCEEETS